MEPRVGMSHNVTKNLFRCKLMPSGETTCAMTLPAQFRCTGA